MSDRRAGVLVLALAAAACKTSTEKPAATEGTGCSLSPELLDAALGPSSSAPEVSRTKFPDTCLYKSNNRHLSVVRFANVADSREHRLLVKRGASSVADVGEEAYFAVGGRITQLMAYRRTGAVFLETRGDSSASSAVLAAAVKTVLDRVEPP